MDLVLHPLGDGIRGISCRKLFTVRVAAFIRLLTKVDLVLRRISAIIRTSLTIALLEPLYFAGLAFNLPSRSVHISAELWARIPPLCIGKLLSGYRAL